MYPINVHAMTILHQGLLNPPSQNLCYINSTFQCLAACDLLLESSDPVAALAVRLLQQITQKGGPDHLAVVSALKRHLKDFNNIEQQHAFHFLETIASNLRLGGERQECKQLQYYYCSCHFICLTISPCVHSG